jgi:hypothetical protein
LRITNESPQRVWSSGKVFWALRGGRRIGQRLFSGDPIQLIGRKTMRHTRSEWRKIAESTPYFGVLTDKRILNPSENDLLEFFRTGALDISHVLGTEGF